MNAAATGLKPKRGNVPASEILSKFRAGTLHSGKGGKIVKDIHQARAIQLSYARKEGHDIPMKSGMSKHLNDMKAKGVLKSKKTKKY